MSESWTLAHWKWALSRFPFLRKPLNGVSLLHISDVLLEEHGVSVYRFHTATCREDVHFGVLDSYGLQVILSDASRFVLEEYSKCHLQWVLWRFSRDCEYGPTFILAGGLDVDGLLRRTALRRRCRRARDTCQLLESARVPKVLSLVCARFLVHDGINAFV